MNTLKINCLDHCEFKTSSFYDFKKHYEYHVFSNENDGKGEKIECFIIDCQNLAITKKNFQKHYSLYNHSCNEWNLKHTYLISHDSINNSTALYNIVTTSNDIVTAFNDIVTTSNDNVTTSNDIVQNII
jgi:hypothetical protein